MTRPERSRMLRLLAFFSAGAAFFPAALRRGGASFLLFSASFFAGKGGAFFSPVCTGGASLRFPICQMCLPLTRVEKSTPLRRPIEHVWSFSADVSLYVEEQTSKLNPPSCGRKKFPTWSQRSRGSEGERCKPGGGQRKGCRRAHSPSRMTGSKVFLATQTAPRKTVILCLRHHRRLRVLTQDWNALLLRL
jgi:hypothetical protein